MNANRSIPPAPFQFKLDYQSGVPVYRQIIDQVQGGIAAGSLLPGHQLPTVRQVAVDGRLIWADLFASTALLEKYWPKLIRSYAAEALTHHGPVPRFPAGEGPAVKGYRPDMKEAQAFLEDFGARHEEQETEPGVYRRTELKSSDFTAFALTSLLPGTGFDVHIAKMAD